MTTSVETRRPRGRPGRFSDRREEVLRTAARVFSDHGFRQATLEDVASALHMTRPALYHYARSKDDLLSDCAEIAQASLREAVELANAAPTGAAQVATFFRRYAEIICDDFGRCFVLTDRRELAGPVRDMNLANQRELDAAVQAMIRRGVEDGSLRTASPADFSRALYAAFNGIPRWYHAGGPRSPSRIADDFMGLFFEAQSPG